MSCLYLQYLIIYWHERIKGKGCSNQRCVIFILDEDIEPIQLGVGVRIVPGLAVQQKLQPVLLPAPDRKYSSRRLIVS
jgi:hypothetical protein